MKKYLMMGLAAMAIASCSNNDSAYDASRDKVHDTYNAAFRQYVGVSIAPNQTWGFGTDATRSFEDFTRAIEPTFNFPGDAPASKFLADVPGGVEKLTANAASVNNYIDETWSGELNIWGAGTEETGWQASGGVLYIKGNCDFSNRNFYFAGNSELYLLEGATLTLKDGDRGAGGLQQNTMIYIASGAKLVAKGELKLNNGLHIYNHGTIEAPTLSTNSNSVLYNVGTVNISGKMSVENTLSVVVNDGEINAGSVQTAGSGKMQNNADFKVQGETLVNSNDNTWVNNGQYRTGNFTFNASSREVINNCRLTVDNTFAITLGDGEGAFRMDSNSGVVASSMRVSGPFYIEMGANSVFKVTGTAVLDASKANYGIYGPASGDYAVFQANKIEKGKENQGYEVTYGNNLYIYSETTHFANGNSGQYPYIDFKGNCKEANIYASNFTSGKPTVTITETECNPGFEGDKEIQPTGADIRVICEDLSASDATDFDFNDVVFDVKFTSSESATVTIVAAGGTLPLEVAGHEVHEAFGVTDKKTMINTQAGRILTEELKNQGYKAADGLKAQSFTVNGIDRTKWGEDIPVRVQKDGQWYTIEATVGGPTAKIGVDPRFVWPNEKQSIKSKYEGFTGWVTDPTKLWY